MTESVLVEPEESPGGTVITATPRMSEGRNAPTLVEIKTTWPAAVSVEAGSKALGFSRAYGYALIARGEFPAKVIRAGRRCSVITASLVRVLEGDAA